MVWGSFWSTSSYVNNLRWPYPFGGERLSDTTRKTEVQEQPQSTMYVDQTKEAIKELFYKSRSIYTKKFIEDHMLWNRTNSSTGVPYIDLRNSIVKKLKTLETTWSMAEDTHKALKKVKAMLLAYYSDSHWGGIGAAIRTLPKKFRNDKDFQRVVGTLVKNSSQLVSYYEEVKDTQQTFPGWEWLTTDGEQPYMTEANQYHPDEYMMARTNVKPGHLTPAKRFMKKRA